MMNSPYRNVLPPVPPLRTPVYSGHLQIGVLDHSAKRIILHHSPFHYFVAGLEAGSYVRDHDGKLIGRLGYKGQLHRFPPQH